MKQNKKNFLTVAKQSALAGGQILIKEFKKENLGTRAKGAHDLVNRADFLAEKKILRIIKSRFPRHAILAEESGQNKIRSDYLWLVDPLDGSVNFAMRNPIFSVSIALTYKQEIVVGAVYYPLIDKMFTAVKGQGAFLNGRRIKVSAKRKVSQSLVNFCGRAPKSAIKVYGQFKGKALEVRQLGSGAIELAYVAAGYTEAVILPDTNPWDIAAGILLVREAGGQVTNFKGQEWTLKNGPVIATNSLIHQEVLKKCNALK
ncbi:MAG: inositol monophosphatase family protein [bacterium]